MIAMRRSATSEAGWVGLRAVVDALWASHIALPHDLGTSGPRTPSGVRRSVVEAHWPARRPVAGVLLQLGDRAAQVAEEQVRQILAEPVAAHHPQD